MKKFHFVLLFSILSISLIAQIPVLDWAKQMGGTSTDNGSSITVDGAGNVYTTDSFFETVDFDPGAGTFNLTSNGVFDIFISKLDAAGNFVWAKQMGGTESDGAQSMAVDDAGNVFTSGYFRGTADFDPGAGTFSFTSAGDSDVFISKLDASGNFVWAKQIGGIGFEDAVSIKVDPIVGNVFTAGGFTETVDFDPGAGTFNLTSNGALDIFISKLDGSGDFAWALQMGSTKNDDCLSISLDNAGNIHSTGYFEETVDFDPGTGSLDLTSTGGFDIFIQKLRTTPVGLSEHDFLNAIKIYPNPTDGKVMLDLGSISNASVRVFAADGRLVYENNFVNNMDQFEFNGNAGIYFVEIITQESKNSFKLIKN